jgi:hypothetical protein
MRACLIFLTLFVASLTSRVAQCDWVDVRRAGQFRIHAEFKLDRYANLIESIEKQRSDIAATLGLKPNDKPIVVCLFANYTAYSRYVAEHAPAAARRRAVFVQDEDTGYVYVYRQRKFETDLRHELTHAIVHSMLPFIPLWLDEGLAEYFEVPSQKRASGNPHQLKMKLASRLGWKPNLTRLENRDEVSEFSAANYRESWAWVHFLLHSSDESNKLLRGYLATIQNEQLPGPLSSHLKKTGRDSQQRLLDHLRRWR